MPASLFGATKQLIRTTLANCKALQTWQGNAFTVPELSARIFSDVLPPPAASTPGGPPAEQYTPTELDQLRPYVLIYSGGNLSITADSEPAGWTKSSSTWVAELVQSTPQGLVNRPDEADRLFESTIDQVLYTGDLNNPGLIELRQRKHEGFLDWLQIDVAGPIWPEQNEEIGSGMYQTYFLFFQLGFRT